MKYLQNLHQHSTFCDGKNTPEEVVLGFGAVISSDCHDIRKLAIGYDIAEEMLKKAGFREYYILTDNGFVPVEF